MTPDQLAAAMRDLADFGWVLVERLEDAYAVYDAAQRAGVPRDCLWVRSAAGGWWCVEVSGTWIRERLQRLESAVATRGATVRLVVDSGRPRLLAEAQLSLRDAVELCVQALRRGRARMLVVLEPGEVHQALIRQAFMLPVDEGVSPDGRQEGA